MSTSEEHSDSSSSLLPPRFQPWVGPCAVALVVCELIAYAWHTPHITAQLKREDYRIIELLSPIPLIAFLIIDASWRTCHMRLRVLLVAQSFALLYGGVTMQLNERYPLWYNQSHLLMLRIALGLCLLVAHLVFFLGWRVRPKQRDPRIFAAAFGACASMGIFSLLNHYCWQRLGAVMTTCSAYLVSSLGIPAEIGTVKDGYLIRTSEFSVKVLPDCAGFEGMFLLFYIVSIIVIQNDRVRTSGAVVEFYLFGLMMMALLNVIRIALLVVVGHTQPLMRIQIVLITHSYAAPLLYCAVVSAYAYVICRLAARGKQHREPSDGVVPT